MLFQPADLPRPIRLQGVFVSDKEIANIGEHWRAEAEPHYDMGIIERTKSPRTPSRRSTTRPTGSSWMRWASSRSTIVHPRRSCSDV